MVDREEYALWLKVLATLNEVPGTVVCCPKSN